MKQTIETNQEKIFIRQFERCKAELLEANCPKLYIDCVSKYFNFTKEDIIGIRSPKNANRENYNR